MPLMPKRTKYRKQQKGRKREKDLQIGTKNFYEPAFERGNKNIRKEE